LAVSLAALPVGEDPDTLLLKSGPEAFAEVLKSALTPMGFLIGIFKERGNIDSQEGLMRATRAVIDLATHAQGAVQTEQMLREAEAALGVSFDALQSDLRRALRQKYRPASVGASQTPEAGSAIEHPTDEVELATLLGIQADSEVAGLVRQWLPYPLISDPVCRAVIHVLAEEEEPDLMAALDEEDEACKALAAQVVNAPQKLVGTEEDMTAAKAAQDLILSIWRRYMERRRIELTHQMKTLQGEARQPVVEEFAQLLPILNSLFSHPSCFLVFPVLPLRSPCSLVRHASHGAIELAFDLRLRLGLCTRLFLINPDFYFSFSYW